jgi:hypothetical protein
VPEALSSEVLPVRPSEVSSETEETEPPLLETPSTKPRSRPTAPYYARLSWNLERLGLDLAHSSIVLRRHYVEQIRAILGDPDNPQSVYLYGQPMVGKSDLLMRLRKELRNEYIPVSVPTSSSSVTDHTAFLWEIAQCIQTEIEFSDIENPSISSIVQQKFDETTDFVRLIGELSRETCIAGKPFLFMFDDLDYLVRDGNGQIFEYLAWFVRHHREWVRFIFAGRPEEYDYETNPALARLLATSEHIPVKCFTLEASRALVVALTEPHYVFAEEALERIVFLVDGHPCVLKKVLNAVHDYWQELGRPEVISEQQIEAVIEKERTALRPVLTDIHRVLSDDEKRFLAEIAQDPGMYCQPYRVASGSAADQNEVLKELARRQILDYDSTSTDYLVRLGLLLCFVRKRIRA